LFSLLASSAWGCAGADSGVEESDLGSPVADTSAASEASGDGGAGDARPQLVLGNPADTGADAGAAQADPGPVSTDAVTGPTDPGTAQTEEGVATSDAGSDCADPADFDYRCDAALPSTCPGGICLLGLCLGPVLDTSVWDDCGDGTCGGCEDADLCPADCGDPPTFTGEKVYDNDTTMSVWVHGFSNKSKDEMASEMYGVAEGCGGVFDTMEAFGIHAPCGNTPEGEAAPNQRLEVGYYGGVPAPWLSPEDVAEIEAYPYDGGTAGLYRYALIVAKMIRHRLDASGATHVNMLCHSMGCLVTRTLIENDLEGLASENRFARWTTSAGVLAGARLARLFDNPTVRSGAELLPWDFNDFVIMNPDFVRQAAAPWDHRLYEANNPLLGGTLIHHMSGSDPRIAEAMNITLLDLNNPGDEPNDGIMFSRDTYFHHQPDALAARSVEGRPMKPTGTWVHVDHMNVPKSDASRVMMSAAATQRRWVRISLEEIELIDDLESNGLTDFEHAGSPPAEIAVEVRVRFNPYVQQALGRDVLVHEALIEQRVPELFEQAEGTTAQPGYALFSGPVFDAMEQLHLSIEVLEVDLYRRFGLSELSFDLDPHDALASYSGAVPLNEHSFEVRSDKARLSIGVQVDAAY